MRVRDIQKQELVKEKAIELIVKDGLENFSVNKLAKLCNISVATLYIYYKDKDDLILQIATELAFQKTTAILTNFNHELSFEEGMRLQWLNRSQFMLNNPLKSIVMEKLRGSSFFNQVGTLVFTEFKKVMGKFIENAINNGEIDPMPLEVFWSVAFAPMYNLVRFHNEGMSIAGRQFTLTDDVLWQTFDKVIKGLKK